MHLKIQSKVIKHKIVQNATGRYILFECNRHYFHENGKNK